MLKEYVNNPKLLAADIKELVLSGEVNPIMVKVMFDIFSQAMKDKEVRDAILSEADLHNKDFEVNGFKFIKSTSTKYSYKHDKEWSEIEKQKKDREKVLKAAIDNARS